MTDTEPEQNEKPARGAWHDQAREMRASGLTYHEIGRRLGVSGPAVYFALHPERRSRNKKGAKAPPQSVPSA